MERVEKFVVAPDGSKLERKWYLVDATDVPLGRLASQVAKILMGKHKPTYTPHVDTGDFVIIINASKVKLTGKKLDQKIYYRYSGYPGGLKERTAREMLQKHPERVIKLAVKRMLPKTRLGAKMLKKLKIFTGPEHIHEAQKPETIELVK
ncbi:50S ribosomal protein L13 [Kosmotoga sp. DU53]|nr:50S ribosomal protein L13 [Kosmotoga sp. DU53]